MGLGGSRLKARRHLKIYSGGYACFEISKRKLGGSASLGQPRPKIASGSQLRLAVPFVLKGLTASHFHNPQFVTS
jgi:hypothetical protein